MSLIRFPGRQPAAGPIDRSDEIEAALRGETTGPVAESWRLLRQDVRALAPPLDQDFERELQERLAGWTAEGRGAAKPLLDARLARLREALAGLLGLVGRHQLAACGAAIALIAAVLTLVLVGPLRSGSDWLSEESSLQGAVIKSPPRAKAGDAPASGVATAGSSSTFAPSATGSATSAPGRLQQLGASVALATSSAGVQDVAESISRLAVGDGGFVESSHVQVKSSGPSEADVTLSIPSAKLNAAIAALGRIASVRAVSQSSQDITGAYDLARRRLDDALAERRALLRALAVASTQGQIDSLRDQLSGNREALSRDHASVRSVSHQAADSQLYVTITGAKATSGGGLTLRRGLDDAGHVLATAGAALLIGLAGLLPGLAGLLPLTALAFCLLAARRAWRRRRREAALDL
jgi:hypothetical protein